MHDLRKGRFTARIKRNERLSASSYLVVLERPAGFSDAEPGHFISIRVIDSAVPLLMRPFSLLDLTDDSILLLVKVVGTGSRILAAKVPGDSVDIAGPLGGNTFPGPGGGNALFVAGGTGLASMIFAARTWNARGTVGDSFLFYGAGCEDELLYSLIEEDFKAVECSTLDGSAGFHGDVVSLCEEKLKNGISADILYSCGPSGMVRALEEKVACHFREHYTSLEAVMACGVGACRGCTVPIRSVDETAFRTVCSDGTVFRAREIAWEEWDE